MRIKHFRTSRFVLALMAMLALSGCGPSSRVNPVVLDRTRKMYGAPEDSKLSVALLKRPVLPILDDSAGLEEYIAYGLANDPGLRASFDRWRSAMQKVPQAQSLPDPQLTFTYFLERIQTKTGPQRAQVKVAQMFPWSGKRRLRAEVAEKHAEAMWWSVQAKQIELVREIKRGYYDYAYLAHAVRILKESLELLKQLEPVVRRKVQAGGDQAALIRLQVEIGKLENELKSMEAYRPALSARIRAAIDYPGDTPLPWPEFTPVQAVDLDRNALRQVLRRSNPMLESLRQKIIKESKNLELANRSGFPDFMVGMTFFETGASDMPVDGSGNDPVAIHLSLNLPIWQQKYSAASRQAELAKAAAAAEQLDLESRLIAELERRLFKLDDAARQVALYRDTLIPRARQSYEITHTSYLTGKAGVLDLIDSERMLLMFEKSYWRANADYAQSLADIVAICGGELP